MLDNIDIGFIDYVLRSIQYGLKPHFPVKVRHKSSLKVARHEVILAILSHRVTLAFALTPALALALMCSFSIRLKPQTTRSRRLASTSSLFRVPIDHKIGSAIAIYCSCQLLIINDFSSLFNPLAINGKTVLLDERRHPTKRDETKIPV